MDEDDPVTPVGRRLDPAAFSWRFSRSSGAGGQHVNTTDSKAELICDVRRLGLSAHLTERVVAALGDDIRIVASTERSQRRNRSEALDRLGVMLDAAMVVPKNRRPTRPSRGSVERRITAKKHNAARKSDRNWRSND